MKKRAKKPCKIRKQSVSKTKISASVVKVTPSEVPTEPVQTPAPDSSNPKWHGSNGKFKKGNPGGRGNPNCQALASHRATLREAREAFSAKDIADVLKKMLRKGKKGDVQAAKVFLEYIVGKPAQSIEANINRNGGAGLSTEELLAVITGKDK